MKSIHFPYDAEGDILEVSLGLERPGRRTGVELNDNIVVVPGHGPLTTIGHEREYNPFLQAF